MLTHRADTRTQRAEARTRRPQRDDRGSGTALGVAILYPVLMLVIVVISTLSESTRIEQSLQATVNRAARTAALCCHYTGGANGAEAVVRASLAQAERGTYESVRCNNDFVGDSTVVFIDVNDVEVAIDPGNAVPPGGTVYVLATCQIPFEVIGGVWLPGLDAERTVLGLASVDPYRSRRGA